jgi:hypothetical protein
MIRRLRRMAIALLAAVPSLANAADTGAVGNGDWSSVATWTNGVPGATDNAYVGSTFPSGAAAAATVTLSQNSSAANVYLGDGLGTTGTLDLNGFKLSANNLFLGANGGSGSILRTGGGTITISTPSPSTIGLLSVRSSGSFLFAAGDVVQDLHVADNATATTAAVGNLTKYASVDPAGTLNLAANLSPSFGIDVRGTLNANGHAISAPTGNIYLGYYGGPFVLNNRGPISASNLAVSSEFTPNLTSFSLTTADRVTTFALYGVGTALSAGTAVQNLNLYSNGAASPTYATATTATTGNVTSGIYVDSGCTLTLGADLNLTGGATVYGTLNANGRAITANSVSLYNWPLSLANRGPISTANLAVSAAAGQSPAFNFGPSDAVTGTLTLSGVSAVLPSTAAVQNLNLNSNGASPPSYASVSTTATTNVSTSVSVGNGCTLTLGADLNLTGTYPTAIVSVNGTLNANGHAISAQQIGFSNWPLSLTNRGPLTTTVSLAVSAAAGQIQPVFNFTPSDTIAGNLGMNGVVTTLPSTIALQSLYINSNGYTPSSYAAVTTSATTNVGNSVYLTQGCSLNLGADLSLSGTLDWSGTLDAAGHAISAQTINLRPSYAIANRGPIAAGSMTVLSTAGAGPAVFNPLPGDAIGSLYLQGANSSLGAGVAVQNLNLYFDNSNNSTAATTTVGNVTNSVSVDIHCVLNMGADLKLSLAADPNNTGRLAVYGTVNANGHAIAAGNISLTSNGAPFVLANRGAITTNDLEVGTYGGNPPTFNLTPADAVGTFGLNGANTTLSPGVVVQNLYVRDNRLISNGIITPVTSTAATTTTGNVTSSVLVDYGCALTLGADMNLTGSATVYGTIDANGHSITAGNMNLRGYFTLANRGPISAGSLMIVAASGQSPITFNFTPADSVTTSLTLEGANIVLPPSLGVRQLIVADNGYFPPTPSAATTTAVGNVTDLVQVDKGGTLTLGADLVLAGTFGELVVNVGNLNANAKTISATSVLVSGMPAILSNDGMVTAGKWSQGGGSRVRLNHAGDALGSLLLAQSSALTLGDAAGQMIGLTVGNPTLSDLSVDPTSDLVLEVNGLAGGWVFRWANPSGGDHIADLQSLINAGEMTFAPLNGGSYSLSSDAAYTYVNVIPVPEPGTLALAGVAAIGWVTHWRRRWQSNHPSSTLPA